MRRSSRKDSVSSLNRGPRESRLSIMFREYEESFEAGYSDDEPGIIAGSRLYNLEDEDEDQNAEGQPQVEVERKSNIKSFTFIYRNSHLGFLLYIEIWASYNLFEMNH